MTQRNSDQTAPAPTSSRRALLTALAIGLLAAPRHALAHAILVGSEPPAGGHVPAGPVTLKLHFNSRIDRRRSRLLLVRPDRSQTTLPIDPHSTANLLVTQAPLAAGAYTVRWQVLSVDGHITRGDLPFSVTSP